MESRQAGETLTGTGRGFNRSTEGTDHSFRIRPLPLWLSIS